MESFYHVGGPHQVGKLLLFGHNLCWKYFWITSQTREHRSIYTLLFLMFHSIIYMHINDLPSETGPVPVWKKMKRNIEKETEIGSNYYERKKCMNFVIIIMFKIIVLLWWLLIFVGFSSYNLTQGMHICTKYWSYFVTVVASTLYYVPSMNKDK